MLVSPKMKPGQPRLGHTVRPMIHSRGCGHAEKRGCDPRTTPPLDFRLTPRFCKRTCENHCPWQQRVWFQNMAHRLLGFTQLDGIHREHLPICWNQQGEASPPSAQGHAAISPRRFGRHGVHGCGGAIPSQAAKGVRLRPAMPSISGHRLDRHG